MGKKSALDIDSDDYAIYIAEYQDKIAEVHLDYFGRHTIREIQLITANDTIIGDIVNNSITFMKNGERIQFNEMRDDYQLRELEYFLDMVYASDNSISNSIFHALKVLDLTQGEISEGVWET